MPETKLSKIQRIKHLQLQGFTPDEASKMQKVSIYEVLAVYNEDSVFNNPYQIKLNQSYGTNNKGGSKLLPL